MALPAPHALQVGSRLGRYELTRFLGEGGFAEVWLGRDAEDPTRREVAIKLVRRGRVATAGERAMFLDEANIAAGIRHENVVRVFEIGDEDGLPYLVMEHVSGGSLETVIRGSQALSEPVPIAIAVALAAETCAGLHAAHELVLDGRPQHVVHRDVSPQNILITEAGVPKVIDFGIAKARERISKQTSTGIAKGKIAYMSPEQARGVAIDRRADIWAVGAVLFELLEGRRALGGPNEIARLQALVSRPLRPTFSRTPERIANIIRRALSFRARDRQETADELRLELEQALAAEGLGATSAQISEYCARARVAAELSEAPPEAPRDLEEVLPADEAVATISAVAKVPIPRSRSRRAALGVLTAVLVLIGGGVVVRLATAHHGETQPSAITPPPSPEEITGAAAIPASGAPGASASASPDPSSARSAEASATRAVPSAPVKRAPKKPTRRPSDYGQIE